MSFLTPASFGSLLFSLALVLPQTTQNIFAQPDERSTPNGLPLTASLYPTLEPWGPLAAFEKNPPEFLWRLSPLFSYKINDSVDLAEFDLIYPLISHDRFGREKRFHLIQLFSVSSGETQDETPKRRVTLFPIYFQQRSPDPEENYTAVLPFYGHLKNRLFRDKIFFVLMPIYVKTEKKDLVTENYLYPFFHRRWGDQLWGWQFWPVIGREAKLPTTRTNSLDEVELVGGHKKLFILWPFYIHHQLELGTDNPQEYLVSLPFYSRLRSPQRNSSTYLWPFFNVIDDRAKKYREWDFPWPLVVFARGEGKTANRVWPLFGETRNPILESRFYLWPLYKMNRAKAPPLERERTRILFFLYSDLMEKDVVSGRAARRRDFWPLFTYRRDREGDEAFQALSILEPLLPNNKSIERNYSPVWALWRWESQPAMGAASQSVLWNLYRRETRPGVKKISLFFGLFQYESRAEGKQWRIIYLPAGKTR